MVREDGWENSAPGLNDGKVAPIWAVRPRLGIAELCLYLWRAKWLMIAVFTPLFLMALVLAFMSPVKYHAVSRIKVTLGSEDVFNPIVGPGTGFAPEQEQLIEGEIELLRSPVIADRVLEEIGLARLYPELAKTIQNAPPNRRYALRETAVQALQKSLSAEAAPKNPVVRTAVVAKTPELASETLNAFIDNYLEYRSELFFNNDMTKIIERRQQTQLKLDDVNEQMHVFLTEHDISDFDTERASVAGLYSSLTDRLYDERASLSASRGRLAGINAQLANTDPEVSLFVESNSEQSLLDLRLERERLLANYTTESAPVQAIDAQIQKVEAFLSETQGQGGTRRRGLNEVYQSLQSRKAELQAEANALEKRVAVLEEQFAVVVERQRELTGLVPEHDALIRERSILEEQVRLLGVRVEEESLKQDVLRSNSDNIQILERARPPVDGSSLKFPIAFAGLMFGGFSALMVGLLFAYTRTSFATVGSVQKTLGLPVLAAAGRY